MHRTAVGFCAVLALAACGDPLRGLDRFGDVPLADGAANVAPAASETANAGGGLFGRLLNRQPDDPTNAAVEAALAAATAEAATDAGGAVEAPVVVVNEEPRQGGLFGLFRNNRPTEATIVDVPADAIEDAEPEAVIVEAAVTTPPQDVATPRRGLAGLFRRSPDTSAPRNGPDAADVEAGTVLPFGEIARVCGLRGSQLGTEIEGGGGFRIYDSNPDATAPRPFYVTGFTDNCARTFTGAVAVAGTPQIHEFVRYQPSNRNIAYTTADNAYEAIKASVCRVGRGQPCGGNSDRLSRNTQFITVYSFFGGTFSAVPTRWTQILLHDGDVLAVSVKDG